MSLSQSQDDDNLILESSTPPIRRELSFRSDLINARKFKSDFELACFHSFMKSMLPPLLLSHVHPGFHVQYMPEVVEMIINFDGLRNIVLACGATRITKLGDSSEMGSAELSFYTRAVTEVNHALAKVDWNSEDTDDAVLMAVCFLYIHGVSPLNIIRASSSTEGFPCRKLTFRRCFPSTRTRTFASTLSVPFN